LLVCPINMRKEIITHINREIKNARAKKPASILVKVNSLSDEELCLKLYEAASAGVEVKAIIRGICCAVFQQKKFKAKPYAISIVDEYLEHARVMVFGNLGKPKVYISSADWMVRNLDHRVEAACPILDPKLKREIIDILNIQLKDNVKARILDNHLSNEYVEQENKKKFKSQIETYAYLAKKKLASPMLARYKKHIPITGTTN